MALYPSTTKVLSRGWKGMAPLKLPWLRFDISTQRSIIAIRKQQLQMNTNFEKRRIGR